MQVHILDHITNRFIKGLKYFCFRKTDYERITGFLLTLVRHYTFSDAIKNIVVTDDIMKNN